MSALFAHIATAAWAGTAVVTARWDDAGVHILDVAEGGGRARLSTTFPAADPRWVSAPGGGAAMRAEGVGRWRIAWANAPADPIPASTLRGPVLAPTLLHGTGPDAERLDLVILGDGYQEAELPRFAEDADAVLTALLALEPWARHANLLNVWRADATSSASGISHAEYATPLIRETAWSCTYGCQDLSRLICCDEAAMVDAVSSKLPAFDAILVIVNDPTYGGAGGFTYAAATNGEDGVEVAVHEVGHALVGLWDEYDYGLAGTGSVGPNCAADPSTTPWESWEDEVGVGAFDGCSYSDLVRPTEEGCIMRTLDGDYCPVCRQEAMYAIFDKLPTLVGSTNPPIGTPISNKGPTTVSLEPFDPNLPWTIRWQVGDTVVGEGEQIDLACADVEGNLSATLTLVSEFVRDDPYAATWETVGAWPVDVGPCTGCSCDSSGSPWVALLGAAGLLRRRR